MRIFLAGVACVGKSTIGAKLAHILDYQFFDLDHEIEKFFGTSIERLRNRYLTPPSFRAQASQALTDLLARTGCTDSVIALPPRAPVLALWMIVSSVILTRELLKQSARWLTEASKLLVGHHTEFSNDCNLEDCGWTPKIIECACDLFVPFVHELICSKVSFVRAAAIIW
jgi:Shikimate kinase